MPTLKMAPREGRVSTIMRRKRADNYLPALSGELVIFVLGEPDNTYEEPEMITQGMATAEDTDTEPDSDLDTDKTDEDEGVATATI